MCMNAAIYKKEDTATYVHSEQLDYTISIQPPKFVWAQHPFFEKVPTMSQWHPSIVCVMQKQTLHFDNVDINLPCHDA